MDCTLLPKSPQQIKYSEGDLSEIGDSPLRISMGMYIVVISGRALMNVGAETYTLTPQMELSFSFGTIIQCSERSDDFRVRLFVYTRELFTQISLPIDHKFFEYHEEHPTYTHTPDERSQRTWREVVLWMDVAKMLFSEHSTLRFPKQQEESFLEGFWLWNFGTIQERLDTQKRFSSRQHIGRRFIRLVKEKSVKYHRADYYAQKLNISQRYLNKVVSLNTGGRTPKQVIDDHLIAEIKERLIDPSLSITQIAYLMNFPDQSYLSRFFRRHTGISPLQYRSERLGKN